MAVKALSRAWRAVAGLYRVPGQESAPTEIEPGVPVQFVHDLAREAEYTRQETFEISFGIVALAGTTQRSSLTRPAVFTNQPCIDAMTRLGISNEHQVDLWLTNFWAYQNAGSALANLVDLKIGVIQGGPSVHGFFASVLAFYDDRLSGASLVNASNHALIWTDAATVAHNGHEAAQQKLPVFLFDAAGTSVLGALTAGAGGAFTADIILRFAVVPAGSPPPRFL